MVYTVDIPQPTDDPSQSQGQILGNFQGINTLVNVNHVDFDEADEGKHKFLQMPEQAAAPATAANEAGLFAQESSLTAVTELVFRRESSGTEIEFTGLLANTNGWTRLPSGILLKWGSGSGSGAVTVVFPTGATIPAFSNVFSAQVSVEDSSGTPNTFATFQSMTTLQLVAFSSGRITTAAANASFRYLVIGN